MLTLLAAVLGFVTITSLGFVLVGGGDSRERAVKRARTFTQREPQRARAASARGTTQQSAEQRRKQIMQQLKDADRAERKARVHLAARLRQAGLTMSVQTFWIISVAAGLGAGVLSLLFMPPLLALGMAVVVGLGLPRWVLGFLGKRRMKKFSGEFANAVDILVRGIKSGLPVHDSLKVIARESPAPLGPEFQRLVENVGMGLTLEQALEKMYERIPTPELRFFAIVVSIQSKTGGNLAEALSNLTSVLRSRKQMGEKIKALASEATASAAIIGSLPPAVMLIVLVTTPAYMMLMFTDPRGQLMLLGGALWMGAGIFVMKKMIAFKF